MVDVESDGRLVRVKTNPLCEKKLRSEAQIEVFFLFR